MSLRLGLVTPVVSMNPRVARRWEVDAEADDLVEVAEAADLLGYHHLTCSEHVAVPAGDVTWSGAPRGTRYHDPAVTLSWLAARTTRIRLATHVLVAGYHHPVQVAKTYGTLDRLSGGRVVLGIGVGSSRTEFDLLGVPFQDRGARADDFLRALRAVWGRREPTYRGSHFDIDGVVVDPCATSPELRLWIGGRSARSLRRAVELGDGWVPFGLRPAQVAELLARARDTGGWSSRRDDRGCALPPRVGGRAGRAARGHRRPGPGGGRIRALTGTPRAGRPRRRGRSDYSAGTPSPAP